MKIVEMLPIFAGIGLFLFGMSMLGGALEKLAGAKLEHKLEKLTSNRMKGVLLGTGVTAVIQSSSATSIMVVGLLNAGIMKLSHAVPVIMGANIGTTVTGQILRLGDLGDANVLLSLLKPSAFGPILIGIGAAMNLFCKKRKKKDIGVILLGLGMIFFGMNTMEKTLSPLKDMPWFNEVFTVFHNPLLGILLGALMTAVLQSSSASVGILQALSSTGAITFSTAVPIILGQNVGKCVTVVLASIGSKKDAKRAVFIDVLTNTCGMIIFFVVIYTYQAIFGFSFWEHAMTRGNIADFHTLFNLGTSLLLLPFIGVLISVAKRFVKDEEINKDEEILNVLDELLLQTPNVALEQCRKALNSMSDIAAENVNKAMDLLNNFTQERFDEVSESEEVLDKFESTITNYLVAVTSRDLTDADNRNATEMLHVVSEIERIGDHAMNIAEVAQYNFDNGISFSEEAFEELDTMGGAVREILQHAVHAYHTKDLKEGINIEPLEEVIDYLQVELKAIHVDRLCEGKCNVRAGISYIELLTNYERISDHCSNLGIAIIQAYENDYHDFDCHKHISALHKEPTPEYKESYNYYLDKYKINRVNNY